MSILKLWNHSNPSKIKHQEKLLLIGYENNTHHYSFKICFKNKKLILDKKKLHKEIGYPYNRLMILYINEDYPNNGYKLDLKMDFSIIFLLKDYILKNKPINSNGEML